MLNAPSVSTFFDLCKFKQQVKLFGGRGKRDISFSLSPKVGLTLRLHHPERHCRLQSNSRILMMLYLKDSS